MALLPNDLASLENVAAELPHRKSRKVRSKSPLWSVGGNGDRICPGHSRYFSSDYRHCERAGDDARWPVWMDLRISPM